MVCSVQLLVRKHLLTIMAKTLICLEGLIGAGKSRLMDELRASQTEWHFLPEPIEKWCNWQGRNYLEEFYADMPNFAATFQHMVMDTFMEQAELFRGMPAGSIVVWERSPYAAVNIFSRLCMEVGYLNQQQYDGLQTDLQVRFGDLFKPAPADCTVKWIYVRCSPATAMERAIARGRKEERERLTTGYMKKLFDIHEELFGGVSSTKCMVVNTDGLDRDLFGPVCSHISTWAV